MGANRIIFLVTIMFMAGAIAGAICSPVFAKEITVGDDSEADFISIQKAVNNSSSGDVILVLPGIYNESVSVRTGGLSILSKSGNPEDTVIQAFNLAASNTVVNGFSIYENVSMRPVYASSQRFIENCTLRNNLFLENNSGIILGNCYNSTVENNIFLRSDTGIDGIECNNCVFSGNRLSDSRIYLSSGGSETNTTIVNNTLQNSQIGISYCSRNKILNNTIDGSGLSPSGVGIIESHDNIIDNNSIFNCSDGICACFISGGNYITNNTLTSNTRGIIVCHYSPENLIKNNIISNNSIGLSLGDTALVTGNRIELNKESGIYLDLSVEDSSSGSNLTHIIYNNFFNNTVNLFNNTEIENPRHSIQEVDEAVWNTTKTSGKNIVGGPCLGGNYWAKPDGTGFSEVCIDLDGDWICDSSYNINGSEVDYLPLSSLSRPQI